MQSPAIMASPNFDNTKAAVPMPVIPKLVDIKPENIASNPIPENDQHNSSQHNQVLQTKL